MLLAIDYGNTNGIFAVFDGERLVAQWRCASDPKRTADEYAVWLTQLMSLVALTPKDITGIMLSNVVPTAQRALLQLCERYFKRAPVTVEKALHAIRFANRLKRPEQAGADRLACAVAAHAKYQGPLIVIDFGTATTFDVVAADGGFEGGVITPGINLSMEALYSGAARLPRIAVEQPQQVIGVDTVSAMQSGVFWGYIGLIEGLVSRIKAEYGQPMTVIGTGGLAPLFYNTTDAINFVEPDLILEGLRLLYHASQEAA